MRNLYFIFKGVFPSHHHICDQLLTCYEPSAENEEMFMSMGEPNTRVCSSVFRNPIEINREICACTTIFPGSYEPATNAVVARWK